MAQLCRTVLHVRCDDERLTEEYLLNFWLCHAVFLVFSRVAIIPLETKNQREIHISIMYVSDIYKQEEISLLAFEHPSKGYVNAFVLFAAL